MVVYSFWGLVLVAVSHFRLKPSIRVWTGSAGLPKFFRNPTPDCGAAFGLLVNLLVRANSHAHHGVAAGLFLRFRFTKDSFNTFLLDQDDGFGVQDGFEIRG